MSLAQILAPTRFESPATAGLFVDINLPPIPAAVDDEELQFFVQMNSQSSTNARVRLNLDHGPDGVIHKAHTAVIASSAMAIGDVVAGDASRSVMTLDWLHPMVGIGSSGVGGQWMVVSVWLHRKRYLRGGGFGGSRRLGTYRLESGATGNSPGYPLPMSDSGLMARSASYHVYVLEASASAQLGLAVQHSPDGIAWLNQVSLAPAAVSAGTLKVFDSDATKALGPFFRPVVKMQSAAGERALVEVWELAKAV